MVLSFMAKDIAVLPPTCDSSPVTCCETLFLAVEEVNGLDPAVIELLLQKSGCHYAIAPSEVSIYRLPDSAKRLHTCCSATCPCQEATANLRC